MGGRFSLSSGSLPDDLHLELDSEGLSGRVGVRGSYGTTAKTLPERCLALRGFGSN